MKDNKLKPRIVLTSAGYIADEDDDIQVYQRPWVGLTDDEILKSEWAIGANDVLLNFARAIEAKLKEKNT
jgi:hypothetical protein